MNFKHADIVSILCLILVFCHNFGTPLKLYSTHKEHGSRGVVFGFSRGSHAVNIGSLGVLTCVSGTESACKHDDEMNPIVQYTLARYAV